MASAMTSSEEQTDGSTSEKSQHFRQHLRHILNHKYFHIFVICLVLFDCAIVVTELILEFKILEKEINSYQEQLEELESLISVSPSSWTVHQTSAIENNFTIQTEIPGTTETSHVEQEEEGKENEENHEDDDHHSSLELAKEVLHYTSISILVFFLIEVFFKIYVLRLDYVKHKLEVMDAFIIIISLALDIVSLFESILTISGLLIFFRLWRFVRIFNGILISVEENFNSKLEVQKNKVAKMEKDLEKFMDCCNDKEKEIRKLQSILLENEIKFDS